MKESQRAKKVLKILNKTYPKITVPLKSRNIFTLLISVLLSAQCTDVNVNNVTSKIYPKYYKPHHFRKLGRKKIEKLIKKIGIFRIKAKSIHNLSIFFLPNFIKCSGLKYFGYIFFVTLLTLISVHWADKRTDTKSVKIFLCFNGTGAVG